MDEANLRVHVSALRKALGDIKREPQFIASVPGRGYTFIAPVNRRGNGAAPSLGRHSRNFAPNACPPASSAANRRSRP